MKTYQLDEVEDLMHKLNQLTDHKVKARFAQAGDRHTIDLDVITPEGLGFRTLNNISDLDTLVSILELTTNKESR